MLRENICGPVTFYLSNIGHSSHAEPEVLSVEGSGYGAGNGCLSYTGGAVETQDLPLGGATQLAHCDKLLHENREEARILDAATSVCVCV